MRAKAKAKLKNPLVLQQYTLFLPTPDYWAPDWPDGRVRVKVNLRPPRGPLGLTEGTWTVHVNAWGRDDDGMEIWVDFDSESAARLCYMIWVERVSRWALVTKNMLAEHGFGRA